MHTAHSIHIHSHTHAKCAAEVDFSSTHQHFIGSGSSGNKALLWAVLEAGWIYGCRLNTLLSTVKFTLTTPQKDLLRNASGDECVHSGWLCMAIKIKLKALHAAETKREAVRFLFFFLSPLLRLSARNSFPPGGVLALFNFSFFLPGLPQVVRTVLISRHFPCKLAKNLCRLSSTLRKSALSQEKRGARRVAATAHCICSATLTFEFYQLNTLRL